MQNSAVIFAPAARRRTPFQDESASAPSTAQRNRGFGEQNMALTGF